MSTPHKSLMEDKIRMIAMQEAMQQIRGLKVELIINTCGNVGVSVCAKTTCYGQEISTSNTFIPYPKDGGNNG